MNAQERRKQRRELHAAAHKKGLSAGDRNELKRFASFLRDDANLSRCEMVAKHGEYMGFKPDEISSILRKGSEG